MGNDKKPDSIDYSSKIADMTQYMEDKYGEKFEFVEFEPADRGFNDWKNYNILTLKMDGTDIYTNVKEQVGYPEEYFSTFMDDYASYLIKGAIDYSEVSNLNKAKTYVSTGLYEDSYDLLKNGNIEFTGEYFHGLRCIILIDGDPSEKNLNELYSVYLQKEKLATDLGVEGGSFEVAFGGDLSKNAMYVDNYFNMIDYQDWVYYDETITHAISIVDNLLSFDEFSAQLSDTLSEGAE